MANVSHLLSSDFLSGQEIPVPHVVIVKSAEIKELGRDDEKESKVVLEFNELDKELPLNKTRLKFMVDTFGPETSAWVGKKVMIYGQKLTSGKFSGQWTVILANAPAMPIQSQPAEEEDFTIF